MSTLQQRIDEYLCDKTPMDDVEASKFDAEYLREREEIEMRAIQESLEKLTGDIAEG